MKRAIFRFSQFLVRVYFTLLFRIEVRGQANVPRTGKILLAANHISGYDPPLIGCLIPREVYFMAKKELFRNPLLGNLLRFYNSIPTDRSGTSLSTIKRVEELLARGHAVLLFPEGTRVKSGSLGRLKAGVGMLAARNRVNVVPVHIDGLYHKRGFSLRRPRVKVVFGGVVDVSPLLENAADEKESYLAIAGAVNAGIVELQEVQAPAKMPGRINNP